MVLHIASSCPAAQNESKAAKEHTVEEPLLLELDEGGPIAMGIPPSHTIRARFLISEISTSTGV